MKNQLHTGLLSLLSGMTHQFIVFLSLMAVSLLLQKNNIVRTTDSVSPTGFNSTIQADHRRLENRKQKTVTNFNQLKQSDWYDTAMKNIERAEYKFIKVENTDAYRTPNRKNNLQFYYDENGFIVEPRTTQIPDANHNPTKRPEAIKYKTVPNWKVFFQLDKKQIGKGLWEINENKAEYKTGNIVVQYINNEEGMRQNFIIQQPLSENKDHELKLNFSVKTKLKQNFRSDRLQFVHDKNGAVLNYDQLKVWDANGRLLAAAFEKNKNNYSIHVNTTGATYPITIDPISTTPDAMMEGDQDYAYMGSSVASAGDVNGDGYSDVIVGVPEYGEDLLTAEGAAYIYHGSAAGFSTTPDAIVKSNQFASFLGYSVATAGDVNGDGYSDIIVGAPSYASNGEDIDGAAFIYQGSAAGIDTAAATILSGNQRMPDYGLGVSVACAGDINGDGYSDVIVGAPDYDNMQGRDREGAAFIYPGSRNGISTIATDTLRSNQENARMGWSVAGAGDVNGDGYSDVIAGAPYYENDTILTDHEGAAFIFHGSASGIDTIAAALVESNQPLAELGSALSSAGDINGDGYSDVVVAAPSYALDQNQTADGVAFVYHGSATGTDTSAASMLVCSQPGVVFGWSLSCAGDINGDGYSDLIVGIPGFQNGEFFEGAALIFQGSNTGVNIVASDTIEINRDGAQLGFAVSSGGDVNGDGYSDVIVGDQFFSNDQSLEGAAYVYHGSATGINTAAAAIVESNSAGGQMGYSVATAGDVNGDGYSDMIVGVRNYDDGSIRGGAAFIYYGSTTGINTAVPVIVGTSQNSAAMGQSVAGAGDINGDGYSDIIVGSPEYDNGESNEGAIFIYYGSASGINTATADRLESNVAGARLGWSVASAGDINDDGYTDVVAGADRYTNGQLREGAAFIYYGAAAGINTATPVILESNMIVANMGQSVAGAGDVNGDGYGDILVGVPIYTNSESAEGAVFIYHGSAAGINITAADTLEGNQVGTQMGWSVAGAGDVDGDGYNDVIVGGNGYDNGPAADAGAAFIYHGSANGVNATPAATTTINQGGAQMGYSVASAGDVNGDGYSDVIVGVLSYSNVESFEGAAFIYHGSPAGIDITAATALEGNQANVLLGYSVAGVGDVNGDGISDVIAGAPQAANGGAALIYYGNTANSTSIRNNLELYNIDLVTPVNSTNIKSSYFGAGFFAKSFLGRNKGKLVWETRQNYEPYSGSPITNSVASTAQQPGYTDLGLTGTELKNRIGKRLLGRYTKLRVRVKYNPATAITGQLYGPWRYVPEQVLALSLGVLPVDLISFNATWQQVGKTAKINFTTDNETAISHYEIEKSNDGFNFVTIGQLIAANTQALYTYSFIDNNATGQKQYYRLKTIHQDGNFDYSNIHLLRHNTEIEILVFPNPATDVLHLQLNNRSDKIDVRIVNSSGATVKQLTAVPTATQTLNIPVSTLASGVYFLYLQTGMEEHVLQFIKN